MIQVILSWILTQATKFEHLFTGKDNKWSIRRIMAGGAFLKFILMSCETGSSDAYIWALVALIGGLLGLTTLQNMKANEQQV
jgi:hypothetical protein